MKYYLMLLLLISSKSFSQNIVDFGIGLEQNKTTVVNIQGTKDSYSINTITTNPHEIPKSYQVNKINNSYFIQDNSIKSIKRSSIYDNTNYYIDKQKESRTTKIIVIYYDQSFNSCR